jgi:hypothetical protein
MDKGVRGLVDHMRSHVSDLRDSVMPHGTSNCELTDLKCSLFSGRIRSQERATVRVIIITVIAFPRSKSVWESTRGREPRYVVVLIVSRGLQGGGRGRRNW